jgi:hypothetical protein
LSAARTLPATATTLTTPTTALSTSTTASTDGFLVSLSRAGQLFLAARAGELPVVLCHVTAPWTGELLLLRTDATPCRNRDRQPLPRTHAC